MKTYIIAILLALMALPGSAFDYAAADSAYVRGDYQRAADLYSQAVETEGVSAALLYDLGNAYYRLGRDGEAVVCYERAHRLDPSNPAVRRNLDFLSARVLEANKGELAGQPGNVEPDHETFMQSLYRAIAVETRSDSWAVFAVMAFILFLGSLAMYVFTPNVLARKTGFFSGLVFLGFTAVFLVFAFIGADRFERHDEAVVTEFSVELLRSPQAGSPSASSPLHKGTKVRVLGEEAAADGSRWLHVRLNADNSGWLPAGQLEVI